MKTQHPNPGRPSTTSTLTRLGWSLTLGLLSIAQPSWAQISEVGDIARDFSVVNRATGNPINLTDYEGHVVVLDFFAYWCGPCRVSSPDLEANVNDYYLAQNGNAQGVPVVVLPVNIEAGNEPATDLFIQESGLDLVANDYSANAYNQFATGYIPLFVIINGVADSPSHQPWEVLFRDSGYPGAPALRAIIDSVQASDPTAPPTIRTVSPGTMLLVGTPISLRVQASGAAPLQFQWFKDGAELEGATGETFNRPTSQLSDSGDYHVRVFNDYGSIQSAPIRIEVRHPGTQHVFASGHAPLAIPDNTSVGITSSIVVDQPNALLQLLVSVQITHSYIGDLRVLLQAPWGDSVTLHDLEGGPTQSLTINARQVDEFNGRDPRGTWVLRVLDLAAADVGTLDSWSLQLLGPAPTVAESFALWMEGFPAIPLADRTADADPDLDGIPNLLEYALAEAAPDVPDTAPRLVASPTHADYFELVIPWRPGIDTSPFGVFSCSDLVVGSWTEVTAQGPDVLVDASNPERLILRVHRSLAPLFLQLRSHPTAL